MNCNNNKKLTYNLLFFICISLLIINIINLNSSKNLSNRKLEEKEDDDKSYKIYVIVVSASYIIFIVMDLFILFLIWLYKGIQEPMLRYIYIANNGYLIICLFTWIITKKRVIVLCSYVSISICSLGTIVYFILFIKKLLEFFECNFVKSLFQLLPIIWELFFATINNECSCFKNSKDCCMNMIHYTYTAILVVGFGISSIAYIGFILILIILWSFLSLIFLSIAACFKCCCKKNNKASENNNNNNIENPHHSQDLNLSNQENNNEENNNNQENNNEEGQTQKNNNNNQENNNEEEQTQKNNNYVLNLNKSKESDPKNDNE